MTLPSLPFELHRHIVFFAGLDQTTLLALCLVNSDFRNLAIPHLHSKLVFRSFANLELFFSGSSSDEAGSKEDTSEKKTKRLALVQALMSRKAGELRFVKEIETDTYDPSPVDPIEISPILIAAGPIHIDILRVYLDYHPSLLAPLYRFLSPLRVIVPTYNVAAATQSFPLTLDRPIILDCFGEYSPFLVGLGPGLARILI